MATDEDVNKASPSIDNDADPANATEEDAPSPAKKPGVVSRIWKASGLNVGQVLVIVKGALPPVIALAAFQGDSFAAKFTTLGYLVAIASLLGLCIMPRAKFIQTMTLNIIFICLGAAVATLEMFTAVKARQSTTKTAGATSTGASGSQESDSYNASASAVSAVWLFVTIFVGNTLRAKRPQLMLPVILYSIFTIVASAYSPLFTTMTQVYSFVSRLLQAFLTGFGIAAAVSLFVIPMTSRGMVQKLLVGFLKLISASLGAQKAYLASVGKHRNANKEWSEEETEELSIASKTLKELFNQLVGLFGKMDAEVAFAKREAAYGHFKPKDFSSMITMARDIMLPVGGMTTFIDIIQSLKGRVKGIHKGTEQDERTEAIRRLEYDEWSEVMERSHSIYGELIAAKQGGIQHILYVLKLEKPPKKAKDIEEKWSSPSPGDKEYADHLEEKLRTFTAQRRKTMQEWCEKKGIALPPTFWDDPSHTVSMKDVDRTQQDMSRRRGQTQLYLILYIEYLTYAVGKNILTMIRWADSKAADGTTSQRRMIFPAFSSIRKWAMNVFAAEADDPEDGFATGMNESTEIWAGASYQARKDPEHLPPTTLFQKVTDPLRGIARFFASPEASFGFRVAVATMSLAIVNFLAETQDWFVRQRGIWAAIMTAISMSPHAGAGIFGFLLRIGGTTMAMCTSMIMWYMADQKTAAVLPLMYLFNWPFLYLIIKFPKFAPAAMISMVTPVLIIGYELQVRKIGKTVATSNGQPFYPIYELAPYRLAAVVAGIGVAFIWTYFPYPITTRTTLRKQMGASIYLLANFYSCVHTTTQMRLTERVTAEDENKKGSRAYKLKKARTKVFSKLVTLFASAQENLGYTRLEPTFGGNFPHETYNDLIHSLRHIFNYTSLVSYATDTFTATESNSTTSEDSAAWLHDFRLFASEISLFSHDITSLLCLLSASIESSNPLPPYLNPPASFNLDHQLQITDPELLSIRHISEPCYAAFAVLQIAGSLITEELERATGLIRELVGEVDFSFHVVSTNNSRTTSVGSGGSGGVVNGNGKGKDDKED